MTDITFFDLKDLILAGELDDIAFCDLSSYKISSYNLLSASVKNSVSISAILFMRLVLSAGHIANLSFKIWNNQPDIDYEAIIYRDVIDMCLKRCYTQNFIPFVAYTKCNRTKMFKFLKKNEKVSLGKQTTSNVPVKNTRDARTRDARSGVSILVTEKSQTAMKLHNYYNLPYDGMYNAYGIKSEYCTTDSLDITIMFQLIYTCQLMGMIGLVHNDLHPGNILLDIRDPPEQVIYAVTDVDIYTFPNALVPMLYDWDLSYYEKQGNNPRIVDDKVYLNSLGIYNRTSYKTDLYTILCYLSSKKSHSQSHLTQFADKYINKIAHMASEYCRPKGLNLTDAELPPPIWILLNDPMFNGIGGVGGVRWDKKKQIVVHEKNIFTLPGVNRHKIVGMFT